MPLDLERYLMEIGVIPSTSLAEISAVSNSNQERKASMEKGFFNDPRDENGKVNF